MGNVLVAMIQYPCVVVGEPCRHIEMSDISRPPSALPAAAASDDGRCPKGTQFSVRKGQPNAGQTVAHFEVADIEAVIVDLTSRGVEFQEYETPKTIDYIAQIGPARGAWFADPDGNIFGVREGPVPGI